ncbi:hypothetical protein [Gimesia panareensis]|uniref:Uncharacterized protein n=1 Tax=Gimesia panareensis TaxID=2527978 RepID=A0A518FPZ3_9PLAN|nr:hypothetical protein [Gimesia panareensis]QDT25500.1 hypothetical protein Enr10x_07960 [Gimesia panareensis]QDU48450.1 hypothetical protein Pan110_07640 [Gimesia panareensis]QDV18421.1 hypothetical protein Pan153_30790 [Gimesia panareensis]
MDSPFSVDQRRYLPWSEYRKLEREIAQESLIGRSDLSSEKINSRIRELIGFEKRYGIVYLGERQWLERCAANSRMSYPVWVLYQLNSLLDKGLSESTEAMPGGGWQGYTEDLSLFWRPPELADAWIRMEDIDLTLPGNDSGVDDDGLCEAFRILHNLAYYLHNVPHQDSRPVSLHGITVEREPQHWTADVISEYGSVWSVEFFGDEVRQTG